MPPRRKPWRHQKQGTEFLSANDFPALFSDPGTGKTKMVIDTLYSGGRLPALVIAPLTVLGVWVSELQINGYPPPVIIAGSKKQRDAAMKQPASLYLTNYETLRTSGNQLSIHLVPRLSTVVADESTSIKSRNTEVTKRAVSIFRMVPHKIIMTGTPAPESAVDLFSQFLFLDNGATFGVRFDQFINDWLEPSFSGYGWQLKRPADKTMARLKELLFSRGIHFPSSILKGIPPVRYQTIPLPLLPKQEAPYEQLDEEFEVALKDTTYSTNYVIAKMEKLLQIASGFMLDDDKRVHHFGSLKERWLADFVKNLPEGKRLSVWIRHTEIARHVQEIVQNAGLSCGVISGAEGGPERWDTLRDFADGKIRVVICQAAASRFGISLANADYMVWYENVWSYADRYQAEHRLIRPGGAHRLNIVVYDLVTTGTEDEHLLEVLQRKKDFKEALMERRRG